MNKVIKSTLLGTALVLALNANAQIVGGVRGGGTYRQGYEAESFIPGDVASIVVSNTAGTIIVAGVTNLNSLLSNGSVGAGTNAPLTLWTNYQGTQILVGPSNAGTGTNTDQSAKALLQDVPLWSTRDFAMQLGPQGVSSLTNAAVIGTLQVRIVGRTGKSGTILFRFVPIYSDSLTNEPTATGEKILWGVPVNGVTPVVICTNLLAQRVLGARALRCVDISNGDATSAADAFITELKFVGYAP